MKYVILISTICITQSSLSVQQIITSNKTIIYLVRRGEKEKGDDPLLTEAAKQSSGDSIHILNTKNIQRIYVT